MWPRPTSAATGAAVATTIGTSPRAKARCSCRSVEIAGGLGKEARAFYTQCLEWANGHNNVVSCHSIAMSFRRH
jgi:hypothetical protein